MKLTKNQCSWNIQSIIDFLEFIKFDLGSGNESLMQLSIEHIDYDFIRIDAQWTNRKNEKWIFKKWNQNFWPERDHISDHAYWIVDVY